MFSKIGAIVYRFSYFGEELKSTGIEEEGLKTQNDVNKFLEFSNNWVDNIQKNVQDYKSKMNSFKNKK